MKKFPLLAVLLYLSSIVINAQIDSANAVLVANTYWKVFDRALLDSTVGSYIITGTNCAKINNSDIIWGFNESNIHTKDINYITFFDLKVNDTLNLHIGIFPILDKRDGRNNRINIKYGAYIYGEEIYSYYRNFTKEQIKGNINIHEDAVKLPTGAILFIRDNIWLDAVYVPNKMLELRDYNFLQ